MCRYQGGPNAGHTIVVGDETYKIRALPSGIVARQAVRDRQRLRRRPRGADRRARRVRGARPLDRRGLRLGQRAPDHAVAPRDRPGERAPARQARDRHDAAAASGPCYADKAMRLGIRVQDMLDPKILRQKIEVALAEKNLWLERVYESEPFDLETVAVAVRGLRAAAAPVRHRHVALRRQRAARRQVRALRGRAGDAARPRPRHVSVRHVVEPGRLERGDRRRHRRRAASTA